MSGELVVSVVANDCAVAHGPVKPRFSCANTPVEPGCNIDQMIVQSDELTLKVCCVSGEVAISIAEDERLISPKGAKPAERYDHGDQRDDCDCCGDYGD